jgi:hypothetical protein
MVFSPFDSQVEALNFPESGWPWTARRSKPHLFLIARSGNLDYNLSPDGFLGCRSFSRALHPTLLRFRSPSKFLANFWQISG